MIKMQIEGLDELEKRFSAAPGKYRKAAKKTMEGSLLVLTESVPPYPVRESDYIRTGTLGRRLGSSVTGAVSGQPDIFEIKEQGALFVSGEWGTNLEYAPYVIGENEQAWMHKDIWWTIKTVAERAQAKIQRLWEIFAEEIARYLDRGGNL